MKTLFLSDLHIGTDNCQTEKILDLLKTFGTDTGYSLDALYLVGDIIDFVAMRKRIGWNKQHTTLVQKFLRMSRKGVKIFYIIGNHDYHLEFLDDKTFGDIHILERDQYQASSGDTFLVLHGHQADGFILKHPWLYWLGDGAYEISVFLNRNLNRLRSIFGLEYWSLSLYLKSKVKSALSFVNKVDDYLIRLTQDSYCQGVIYGHTHMAKDEVKYGFRIMNTGCGTEYVSYILDDGQGNIKLHYWK